MTALKSKQSARKKYKLVSWKKINFILISLLFLVGALHIIITNDMAVKGFDIRDLQIESNLLAEKNRKLESNLMILKSYDQLKDRITALQLVVVNDVRHLSSEEATMAKR